MFGLGAVFLLISPQLRLSVYADLESGINGMEAYSPYSYIGAGVAVLIAGGITLYRGRTSALNK